MKNLILITLTSAIAWANSVNAPDMPLDHCYHWLNERSAGYLTFKYNYANKNNGELTFLTTPGTSNGAVAGAGLYCAKTPVGSTSYGDRLIRIDLVDDVVMSDNYGRKACGTNGRFYANQSECDQKPVDILLYDTGSDWYVIKNPQAVKSWSANSDQLIQDMTLGKTESPGVAGHLDMALQAMQAEIKAGAKRLIMNAQARLGLEKILKDPVQLKKIPTMALIDMAASYGGNKVSDQEKNDLYVSNFDKAIRDKYLTYSDIEPVLKSHGFLKGILTSRLEKVNYSQLKSYNTSILIAAVDQLSVKISDNQANLLWQDALVSSGALEGLMKTKLRNDGILRKAFDGALPSVASLSSGIQDSNLAAFIEVLNEYSSKSAKLKNHTALLFTRILKSTTAVNFEALYDGIKNPALMKEEALAELIVQGEKTKFANLDPIGTGLLYEKVKDEFSDKQQSDIEGYLLALPIKVDNKLTYQYLDDYRYGKIKIPKFYDVDTFLMKLADRTIQERSLGKNTTNTFRLFLSGYYYYFSKQIYDAKGDKAKQDARDKAYDFFSRLSDQLLKKKQTGYAYIALQNGLFFSSEKIQDHPLVAGLSVLEKADPATTTLVTRAVQTSLDPSVLMFLSYTEAQKDPSAQTAEKLMGEILKYLASHELTQTLKDPGFIIAQAERKTWANVINNRHYGTNGRVYSDICNFYKTYDKLKSDILKKQADADTAGIEAVKRKAQADFCKKADQDGDTP